MRALLILVLVVLAVVAGAPPAAAQEADALRKELEQLRRRMEELNQRLQRLESQPAPPTPAPATTPTAPAPGAPAPGQTTLMDLARPREPFALATRRGGGQLLFDMGVAGDFVANITQRSVDKADGGTFAGRENRFFPREVELSLFGQIDPYARGTVIVETGEEEPGGEMTVALAEAHLTLLTLPYGFQAKLGQVRNRFGWSNERHAHDLPWVDVPNVYRNFFGEEGLRERGVEVSWLPEWPFFFEALVGLFDGDNEVAFGRGKLNEPLVTGRLRTFFEPGLEHGILLGVSAAHGHTPDRLRSTLAGFDVRYKYTPDGWRHALLTLGAEGIYSIRRAEREAEVFVEGSDEPLIVLEKRTRRHWGWYAYTELQPWLRWALGTRFDWSQYPVNAGREWAIEPYVTFWPSEFLRFRLAYKHTDRSERSPFNDSGGSARLVDELLFQATFILGAHPAHPF
jgi:hypothetical protein